MKNRSYKNQKHIVVFNSADTSTKKRIKRQINNYLTRADYSQDKLAKYIESQLNTPYDRKKVETLLYELGCEKKDRKLIHKGITKKSKSFFDKVSNDSNKRAYEKLIENGGTKEKFIKEWQTNPYSYFLTKYNLKQNETSNLVRMWDLPYRKLNKSYKDLYNELKLLNFTKENIYSYYIINKHTHKELEKYISNLVGWEVGAKRIDNLLKYLEIKKPQNDITDIKGRKSRREKAYAMNLLNKCGYTIEELAERYENELSLTKKRLIAELNSKIENDDFKFTTRWLSRYLDPLLTKTRLGSVSRSELEFREELIKLYPNERMETSVRTLIAPREVDIYFPDLNTAIEFNGDYWHSNEFIEGNHGMTSMEYHQLKYDECKKLGVELLFVWESDWNERSDEILLALDNYFTNGVSSELLCKLV